MNAADDGEDCLDRLVDLFAASTDIAGGETGIDPRLATCCDY